MAHVHVPYKRFGDYAHNLESPGIKSSRHEDEINPNYDAHTKLVKLDDGNYVEIQDDQISRSQYSHACKHRKSGSIIGSVLRSGSGTLAWECSDCEHESSKGQSLIDLYADPNALFLARILNDKLTSHYDKRGGKIADFCEIIYETLSPV